YLLIIFSGVLAENEVSQRTRALSENEKGNVPVECTTTVSNSFFQWYKQYRNGSILFLILGTSEVNVKDRIRASTVVKDNRSRLSIQGVPVSDTATYFCTASTVLRV
uniref:Ig-like domain-containing protein n=1 Tax=Callorhinchus milii TaxID=7868 RepID=A0A4W3GXI8_CALMI